MVQVDNNYATELLEAQKASVASNAMLARYNRCAVGCRVHVIGSGPSNQQYEDFALEPTDKVVVLNGAYVEYGLEADVWLMMESTLPCIAPWFIQQPPPECDVVMDASSAGHLARYPERIASYPLEWWQRVIWCHRWPWGKWSKDIRHGVNGLYYVPAHDEPLGSVALQAIHLAGIMGAAEVHLWGCELYFPEGQQHSYDNEQVYKPGTGVTALKRFNIDSKYQVQPHPDGEYESTDYFIRSAEAIRHVVAHAEAEHDNFRVVDHSRGLINPEAMVAG